MQKILLGFILIFSIYCHINQVTVFPFSNYPMYSKLLDNKNKPSGYKIVGVNSGGEEKEMKISIYAKPFWNLGLQDAITSDHNPEKIRAKMFSALKYYNENAPADKRFTGMRLLIVDLNWSNISSNIDSEEKFSEAVIRNKTIEQEIRL